MAARLALTATLLACLAPTAWGEEGGRPPLPPVTSLEAGPFRRADAVVLAVVEHVTDVRAPGGAAGRQIARVRVEKRWKGPLAPPAAVAVLVQGQRPTLDPGKPSVPYFRAGLRQRFILFLGRSPGGVSYRLQDLFDTEDEAGPEKIAAVDAVARLASLRDPQAKGQKALAALLAMLRSPLGWTKTLAARELAWLAEARPAVFDGASRARLRRVARSARLTPIQRAYLQRLFVHLEAAGVPGAGGAADAGRTASPEEPWRRAWVAADEDAERRPLLERLLRAGVGALARHGWWAYRRCGPVLRRWFLRRLCAERVSLEAGSLRALYAGEEDREVREALVRAVGLLGGSGDVAWLEARAGNLALERPALLALARIRTRAALEILRARRERARGRGETDLAAWIAHLASPAFEAAERRAGRTVGPR